MKRRSARSRRIDAILQSTTTPVFLLDARRRLVFFNDGCARLTGWSADEVLGLVCNYDSAGHAKDPETFVAGLCPPPEVFAGQSAKAAAYLVHRESRSVARSLSFFPLTNEAGATDGVLGIIADIAPPDRPHAESPARALHAELAALRNALRQRYRFDGLIGRCESMRRVLEQVNLARKSMASVLLIGPAGSGKAHLARTIHYESDLTRNRAFVPLDCRVLPAREIRQTLSRTIQLLDDATTPGALAGSILLRNADHLHRDVQQTVAETFSAEYARSEPRLRLLAAATTDLAAGLENDSVREDFYFACSSLAIDLPPLCDRGDDLQLLAQAFLEESNRGAERQIGGFSEAAWQQLREYGWPGDVAELRAVVLEAARAAVRTQIQPDDLPFRFRSGIDAQRVGPLVDAQIESLQDYLERVEAAHIRLALERTDGNRSEAARLLGLSRQRLLRRIDALTIDAKPPASRADD